MVGPAPSLRERKKAATRRSIIDTAVRMFSEHGFDTPTIERIAAAAGVGKGTVYNYFSSKEEILVAFMVEIEGRVQRRVVRIAGAPGPARRILGEYLRYQFRMKRPYHGFVKVFLSQIILRGAELGGHIARMQEFIDPPLVLLFSRLRQRGLLQTPCTGEVLAERFKALHFGLSCLWAMEGPPFRHTFRMLDDQVSMFTQGIERITP